jgi:hypothetical protein
MMEEFLHPLLRAATFAAMLPLAACARDISAEINPDQARDLHLFVSAYHYCVARTAARIDDGRAPVGDVAATAMLHCQAEERDIAGYLATIAVPADFTRRYLEDLLASAARNSATMLLRQRAPAPVTHPV